MKKILVIEDHALMRRNVVTILTMEGYSAISASDGREGVALAGDERPDLILCDVMMPKMDGYEVLAAIRAHPVTAGIPFVFLTAKGEKPEVRAGMNHGADDYLIKPVSRDDLVAALEARFARKQQQRPDFKTLFDSHAPLLSLGITDREAEVLLWIAKGKSNDDISTLLQISIQTVKKHVGAILDALGVENRSSAAIRALEALQQ
jgi:DNA-binding NarL/FixJ family response regulator